MIYYCVQCLALGCGGKWDFWWHLYVPSAITSIFFLPVIPLEKFVMLENLEMLVALSLTSRYTWKPALVLYFHFSYFCCSTCCQPCYRHLLCLLSVHLPLLSQEHVSWKTQCAFWSVYLVKFLNGCIEFTC